jgi:hypothetical protein
MLTIPMPLGHCQELGNEGLRKGHAGMKVVATDRQDRFLISCLNMGNLTQFLQRVWNILPHLDRWLNWQEEKPEMTLLK